MRPLAVRFGISDGLVGTILTAALSSYSTGLLVDRNFPSGTVDDPLMPRMVTYRNDGGGESGVQSYRTYGVNVWADSSVDAENMCHDAMAYLRTAADGVNITRVFDLTGPYEIADDPIAFAGANLAHFYFVFTIAVRGVQA